MPYRNKTTGEIISDEEFQQRSGGLGISPTPGITPETVPGIIPQPEPQRLSFLQRTAGIGKFLGFEPLGRGLALSAARIPGIRRIAAPEIADIEAKQKRGEELTPGEAAQYSSFFGEAPTPKQVIGSAAMVGLTALAPSRPFAKGITAPSFRLAAKELPLAAGRYGLPFARGTRLASTLRSGELGALFGVARALSDNKTAPEIIQQGALTALVAMPLPMVGAMFSGAVRAVKGLPERLYSTIFKITEKDMAAMFRTRAAGGIVNPTLAREAIDRGVMGSNEGMAVYSWQKINFHESQLQSLIRKPEISKIGIPIAKNQYLKVLTSIQGGHKEALLTPKAQEAARLISTLKKTKGNEISPQFALGIRRFIDSSRTLSSFKLNPRLTFKQDAYRIAADNLRKQISTLVPGAKEILNEERFFIQAFDTIVRNAVSEANRRVISLTDAMLGGGGIVAGAPGVGFGAMAAARGFQTPGILTRFAWGMDKTMEQFARLYGFPTGQRLFPGLAGRALFPTITKLTGGTPEEELR